MTPTPSSPLRRLLDRQVPWLYRPVRSVWQSYQARRFDRRYRRLIKYVTGSGGWTVQTGVFRDMQYVAEARCSALLPKLLGTYEAEIADEMERAIGVGYRLIIDIGCAEGYYAIGMARRSCNSEVWAYDTEQLSRTLCERMATMNTVSDRVKVFGAFIEDSVESVPAEQRFFVICDVEGYESTLFTPSVAMAWREADLVIELHDHLGHPCREPVLAAFAATHAARLLDSRVRSHADIKLPPKMSEKDRNLCVDELRQPQQWVILRSRRHL